MRLHRVEITWLGGTASRYGKKTLHLVTLDIDFLIRAVESILNEIGRQVVRI